jgi:hypothetical protein
MAFTFTVVTTPEAETDIRRIYNLETYGGFLAVSPYDSLQKAYGPDARTVVYMRITVIFNVIDNIIYIRRIIWGNTVV